jgi:hypothetical protein
MVLLSFFRAQAEQRALKESGAGVIYAVEELETSQHPHNQRLLLGAFSDLAEQPGCQVILTTHTPVLARLLPVPSLRYIRVDSGDSRSVCPPDETPERVARDLGVLADHDVKLFIGIEGKHDESFLTLISKVLAAAGEDVPDLEALSDGGEIIFFPLSGNNLAYWGSRLRHLNRPEFHLYDRDEGSKTTQQREAAEKVNARPNCKAVLTGKREMENYLHPDAIAEARPEVRISFSDTDDVPLFTAQAVHAAAPGAKPWDELKEGVIEKKVSAAKAWLNSAAVVKMTAKRLTEIDPSGDVRKWLADIKKMLEP